jgi:hypothetical protein
MNKGIKRLGIIASVLWIIVGGLWTRGLVIDDLGRPAAAVLRSCEETITTGIMIGVKPVLSGAVGNMMPPGTAT